MTQHTDEQGLSVPFIPSSTESVDVLFDGQRIWSIDANELRKSHTDWVPWPPQLRAHLNGSSEISIVDSLTRKVLQREKVRFGGSSSVIRIANEFGQPLAVNKWGHLAPTFDSGLQSVKEEILLRTNELITDLTRMGFRPFIVGGTLLGAVRSGKLLPHDDDADVAYLSRFSDPADVALEGLRIANSLEELGYKVVRHSAAHIQMLFTGQSSPGFHIDVFAAFFSPDGHINQPFHVRGKFSLEQMLPFSTVELEGLCFPAPANVDAWLTINYDENWRVPMPGFQLRTPESTVRRFNSWFGNFNFQREFWDLINKNESGPAELWQPGASWLKQQQIDSPTLLELGAGCGDLINDLAVSRPGFRHIAVDFSTEALRRVANLPVTVIHANLNRLSSLTVVRNTSNQPFDVIMHHLLETLTPDARENALRIVRMSLRSGGRAFSTVFGEHSRELSEIDPTTWHLSFQQLAAEAHSMGLDVEQSNIEAAFPERSPYGVEFLLHSPANPTIMLSNVQPQKETSMLHRLMKRIVSRTSIGQELRQLSSRVDALQEELDECRKSSMRVSEITDLLETTLLEQRTAAKE